MNIRPPFLYFNLKYLAGRHETHYTCIEIILQLTVFDPAIYCFFYCNGIKTYYYMYGVTPRRMFDRFKRNYTDQWMFRLSNPN